jgi:hypothetical protein
LDLICANWSTVLVIGFLLLQKSGKTRSKNTGKNGTTETNELLTLEIARAIIRGHTTVQDK